MTEHLSDERIYEMATGEGLPPAAETHLATCPACRTEVARTREIVAGIEALDAASSAPEALEAALRLRLTPRGRPAGARPVSFAGWIGRVAAAAALVLAGGLGHALWSGAQGASVSTAETDPILDLQRTGTDYVAAIGRLVADSNLSAARLRVGREVALAAMSGAAHELRLLSSDPATVEIQRLVLAAWTGDPPERGS